LKVTTLGGALKFNAVSARRQLCGYVCFLSVFQSNALALACWIGILRSILKNCLLALSYLLYAVVLVNTSGMFRFFKVSLSYVN